MEQFSGKGDDPDQNRQNEKDHHPVKTDKSKKRILNDPRIVRPSRQKKIIRGVLEDPDQGRQKPI